MIIRPLLFRPTLRQFQPRDLHIVAELVSNTFREGYDNSIFMNAYTTWPEGFILAELHGKLAGFIMGTVCAPRKARILILVVQQEYRGRGIGTLLLDAFTAQCYVRRITRMSLEVNVNNTNAIRFYMNAGFKIIRTLIQYYRTGDNAYEMERVLI
jgi:ribosomal-protein-alanine N-acetyltransferase